MSQNPNDPGQQFPGAPQQGQPQPGQPQPGTPPQGQPYPGGPQGQQFDPNQPQFQQGFNVQPEPPKSKGASIKKIVSTVFLVAVLAVGGYFALDNFQTTNALKEGNCVVITGTEDDPDAKKVDCDTDEMTYVVGSVSKSEACSQDYMEFTLESSRRGRTTSTTHACLFPNFKVDTCYDDAEADSLMVAKPVECPGGFLRISSIEDSYNAECPADSIPFWSVPTPARTYCAVPVG